MNHGSYMQPITPLYGSSSAEEGARVRLGGAFVRDGLIENFHSQVERVRLYERGGVHPSFVDVAGSSAISSFEQYQQPPHAWYRPNAHLTRGRGGNALGTYALLGTNSGESDEHYVVESRLKAPHATGREMEMLHGLIN